MPFMPLIQIQSSGGAPDRRISPASDPGDGSSGVDAAALDAAVADAAAASSLGAASLDSPALFNATNAAAASAAGDTGARFVYANLAAAPDAILTASSSWEEGRSPHHALPLETDNQVGGLWWFCIALFDFVSSFSFVNFCFVLSWRHSIWFFLINFFYSSSFDSLYIRYSSFFT